MLRHSTCTYKCKWVADCNSCILKHEEVLFLRGQVCAASSELPLLKKKGGGEGEVWIFYTIVYLQNQTCPSKGKSTRLQPLRQVKYIFGRIKTTHHNLFTFFCDVHPLSVGQHMAMRHRSRTPLHPSLYSPLWFPFVCLLSFFLCWTSRSPGEALRYVHLMHPLIGSFFF